jgi:hypothetical protein
MSNIGSRLSGSFGSGSFYRKSIASGSRISTVIGEDNNRRSVSQSSFGGIKNAPPFKKQENNMNLEEIKSEGSAETESQCIDTAAQQEEQTADQLE